MKIGLIDVDGHNFPNLALMKISAYHKDLGDEVEWYLSWNGIQEEYDIVYLSKVFTETYSPDYIYPIYAKEVIKGGYGYDNYKEPFPGYEKQFPDYSIYHDIYPKYKKTAFGYLTRGCPRNCDFCMVGEYEGLKVRKVADLKDFYDPKKYNAIEIMDPNLFANKHSLDLLRQLANSGARVNINQGFDIRILTKEQANIINRMKVNIIHFAWDNMDNVTEKLLTEKRSWLKYRSRDVKVYVLTNFNTTFAEDLYRVKKLRELDYDPYVMIFNKPSAPKEVKLLARYVNNKIIYNSCPSYEEYIASGHKK